MISYNSIDKNREKLSLLICHENKDVFMFLEKFDWRKRIVYVLCNIT